MAKTLDQLSVTDTAKGATINLWLPNISELQNVGAQIQPQLTWVRAFI